MTEASFQSVAIARVAQFWVRCCARRWVRESVVAVATLILCVVLTCMFVRGEGGLNANHKSLFVDVIDGTAHRPYVQRVLLPSIVNAVADSVPTAARAKMEDALLARGAFVRAMDALFPDWDRGYLLEYVLALALMYAALVGFAYGLRYLFAAFYRGPPCAGPIIQLFGLVALVPFFETYASYVYDFPQLCLVTLALGALARGRFSIYVPVFALACFNKETAVLLGLVYMLYHGAYGKLSTIRYLGLGVLQLAILIGSKLWIDERFALNPGGAVENHLARNIMWLPRYSLGSLFSFLAVVVLVAHGWNRKPRFLRVALIMFVPLFALTCFLGFLDELRDYYEVYPVVVLLGAHSVAEWLEAPLEVRECGPLG